jgi:hypothetical protein
MTTALFHFNTTLNGNKTAYGKSKIHYASSVDTVVLIDTVLAAVLCKKYLNLYKLHQYCCILMCAIPVVTVPVLRLLPVSVAIHKLPITPLCRHDQFNLPVYPVINYMYYQTVQHNLKRCQYVKTMACSLTGTASPYGTAQNI